MKQEEKRAVVAAIDSVMHAGIDDSSQRYSFWERGAAPCGSTSEAHRRDRQQTTYDSGRDDGYAPLSDELNMDSRRVKVTIRCHGLTWAHGHYCTSTHSPSDDVRLNILE